MKMYYEYVSPIYFALQYKIRVLLAKTVTFYSARSEFFFRKFHSFYYWNNPDIFYFINNP